jgi:hypothetical protein
LPGNCPWCEIRKLKAELEESAADESTALTQVEKFSVENGRLVDENKRLQLEVCQLGNAADVVAERDKIRLVVADARKAAQSLYAAMMHDDLDRAEIAEASLEKWPWLRPPEPDRPEQDQDGAKFAMMVSHLRIIAEEMLTEFFGPRCDDYEAGCGCCGRWRLLDDLTADPFTRSSEAPQRSEGET